MSAPVQPGSTFRRLFAWPPRPFPARQVAIVRLHGPIAGGGRSAEFVELLRHVRESSKVPAVVLDIDSPGGSATASDDLFLAIQRLAKAKPVVAAIRGVGASGSYLAALGARRRPAWPWQVAGSRGTGRRTRSPSLRASRCRGRPPAPSMTRGRAATARRTRHCARPRRSDREAGRSRPASPGTGGEATRRAGGTWTRAGRERTYVATSWTGPPSYARSLDTALERSSLAVDGARSRRQRHRLRAARATRRSRRSPTCGSPARSSAGAGET